MRLIHAVACAVLLCAFPAAAQAPANKYVVRGDSVPDVPFAVWEDKDQLGTAWHAASGAEVAKAPAKAVRYTTKTVQWPTGIVRVLTFTKAGGGVLYAVAEETQFFVLKGSVQAMAGSETVVLKAGDLAREARGVLRSVGPAEDTTLIAWDVTSLDGKIGPAVVRAQDARTIPSWQWQQDGKTMRAATVEDTKKAPPDAIKLTVTRYEFPGNSVRVANMEKAIHPTVLAKAPTDSLIYLTSGHVRFHQGGEVAELHGGDFIREDASQAHVWEHLEKSSFVTTSALPVGASPMAPAAATDLPSAR